MGPSHFTQLTFCFCSHQGKVNVHACTQWEIISAWQLGPKGYATALHHSLQANSSSSLLAACYSWSIDQSTIYGWSLLNLWIVRTLFQLYTTLWSFFMQLLAYTYICLTYSTITAKQHAPFKLGNCPWIVHTFQYYVNYIVCMHWVEEGMYIQQLYTWVGQFYLLSDKVVICTRSSSTPMHATVSADFFFLLSH